jgi:CBS domain-containing protein
MRVAELMTKDPITARGETGLAEVASLLDKHHLNGLPVVDRSNRLVGIITQGDLLRRPELGTDLRHTRWLTAFLLPSRVEDDYVHTHGRHVSDVMTENPICVSPDTELAEVAELMTTKHLKCLPVMRGSLLVGVISRSDMIRALAGRLVGIGVSSDETIKSDILSSLAREHWAPKAGLRIDVKASVVNLEGVIYSDSERRAVNVIAENVPGVTHVNDHLVYVDVGSGMAFPGMM